MLTTEDQWEHYIDEARLILQKRQGVRQDLWRGIGARGQVVMLHGKSERVFRNLMSTQPSKTEAMKEIPDIINYAVFCAILADEEDWNGKWPWPSV
jgi:hypothetical protein